MTDDRKDWKAIQIPYDAIMAASDETRCYRLTDKQVAILLSQTEMVYWSTRWTRETPFTTLEKAQIRAMAALVEAALMTAEQCCEDIIMDVRQNEENPCILEKTTDGVIWTPFADLSLCIPRLRNNPNNGRLQWSVNDIDFYEFPDGPWGEEKFPPTLPPAREGAPPENKCNAAANGAAVFRHAYAGIAESLIDETNGQFDLYENILDALLAVIGFEIPLIAYGIEMAALLAFRLGFDVAEMTDEDEDDLRCILYAHATDTAGVVTFDYGAVSSDIAGKYLDMEGLQWGLLGIMLTFVGGPGLNLAGSITGVTDADCTDCLETPCLINDDLATGLGPQTHFVTTETQPYSWVDTIYPVGGSWSASGGADGDGNILSDAAEYAGFFFVDLLEDCVITSITLEAKVTVPGSDWTIVTNYRNAANSGSGTGGQAHISPTAFTEYAFFSVSGAIRYILFELYRHSGSGSIRIDNIKVNVEA